MNQLTMNVDINLAAVQGKFMQLMKSIPGIFVMLSIAGLASCMPTLAQHPSTHAAALGPSVLTETVRPLPVGSDRFQFPTDPTAVFSYTSADPIVVFTYKPPTYTDGPLLVVFHGAGRDAEVYRNLAIVLADRFNAIVAAPLFDWDRFKDERYQDGGILRNGQPQAKDQWTFAFIPKLVAHVRALEGRPDMPYHLIGHSAGGQFLARMAAFLPGEARRLVACNPGSLLFPTRDLPFPYGFGGLPQDLSSEEVLRAYLAAPLTLYLGTGDTVQDRDLDMEPVAMNQGPNRLERGRACFEKARGLAAEKQWAFNWRKVEIEGVGHSGSRLFAGKEVEDALFGSNPSSIPCP